MAGKHPALGSMPSSSGRDSAYLQPDSLALLPVVDRDSIFVRDTLIPIPILRSDFKDVVIRPHVVFLPDSLIRDSLWYEFAKIKNIAFKTKLTKELYKMVFVDPRPNTVNVMRTENSEERFKQFHGKIIKNIDIKILPPYGTSVYDTTYNEEDIGWLKFLANKTHMKTAEGVIRKQITLRPGMEVSPFELVQNEILLRQLDNIDDASIFVSEVTGDTTEVNLTFICKDEFSWNAEIESNFLNSAIVGVGNKNFLKLGHIVNYQFSYRGTKDKRWGNILEYKANSIFGTHISFKGYYQNDYREKLVKAELDRQFLTSTMKWAGGVAASRVYYSDDLPDRNVKRLDELFNYHSQDVWLGKSFLLDPKYSYNRNLYLTGRFFTTFFNNRPVVSTDTNHFYYNRMNYLAALTYTKIKYYKANLIYDFGRTEDIPTGLYASFIGGFENNEFQKSGYLGMEYRYSHFNKYTERFYSAYAATGSYVNENGFERGFVKLEGKHISNLCSIGKYKFRFYNNINYMRGIDRYPSDYLYIRDNDIYGFRSDTLRGNQKLSCSLSTTFFLPFIKRGFRMSVSTFLDAGAIAEKGRPLYKSKTYWGVGVGVSLRNDNVVIKNISLRLSYFPTIPDDGRSFQASMSSGMRGKFYDYRVSKPQLIPYE